MKFFLCPNSAGTCKVFLTLLSYVPQILTKMMETPYLSLACCDTLLKVITVLLLDENVFLPDSLVKETVEKVTQR